MKTAMTRPGQPTPRRRWWTVMLLYPDYMTEDYGADIFVDWARTATPEKATAIVKRKAARAQNQDAGNINADDFRMIAVWQGRTTLALDATSDT